MLDKLLKAKQKADEIKARLDTISVSGEAEGGKVRVIVSANKEVKEVFLNDELLLEGDKEKLEELILIATNKALTRADEISQSEMAASSHELIGGLGNLFSS